VCGPRVEEEVEARRDEVRGETMGSAALDEETGTGEVAEGAPSGPTTMTSSRGVNAFWVSVYTC
jgi:hypothetical protein